MIGSHLLGVEPFLTQASLTTEKLMVFEVILEYIIINVDNNAAVVSDWFLLLPSLNCGGLHFPQYVGFQKLWVFVKVGLHMQPDQRSLEIGRSYNVINVL